MVAKFFQGLLVLSILLIMIQTFTYDTTTEKKFLLEICVKLNSTINL